MPYVKFSWLANLSRDVFDIAPKMRQHYALTSHELRVGLIKAKTYSLIYIHADHGSIPDYSNVLPSE